MITRTGLCSVLLLLLAGCGGGGGSSDAAATAPEPEPDTADPRCLADSDGPNWEALADVNCPRLSQYQLFSDGRDPRVGPTAPGLEFAPASGLFSDHANKYRFVFLPEDSAAQYRDTYGLVFPVGTVMVKTFALPVSPGSGNDRLMETRLLIHREAGWVGLPYQWQADGQDATLARTGKVIDTYVMVDGVQQDFRYQIPDVLTCRKCHQGRTDNEVMTPLGTTVRQLNHDFPYPGGVENQLAYWQANGMLTNAPASASWPRAADWHDTSEPLDLRVRSYLDTNCSHCHSDVGSGALSGLRLEMWRDPTDYTYGICNRAQGYYGGPLGLTFDIVPGNGAESVLPFRLGAERHTDTAKDMMPPLGRSLADHDAVALVRQWIDQMPAKECATLD